MAKKRIFTVGFSLPGEEFEYIGFDSDQTLLDADIILYEPTFGNYDFEFDREYGGKRILSHYSSFSTKTRLDHWHAEIVAAVNAGKLVIIFLAKPIEYCRYTGERRYSGTGRSRVQTNIVVDISSYDAVPNIKNVRAKSGSAIRLEKDGTYLAPYWSEFAQFSPYEVEIEGDFNKVILKAQSGDRTVGAAFHGKTGVLLFLPPLRYDDEKFLRDAEEGEDEAEQYWTKEALRFGKRLVAALIGLADVLKQTSLVTPPPTWSLSSEFRLPRESELELGISTCAAQISKLQADKASLERQLSDAGDLRRLLFEQGKPLERAILDAMKILGFDAQSFSDGKSEFDGVFVSAEGRCIGEADGKDNKPINIEKFSQLERNLNEDFARDDVTEHANGLMFGNAHRLKPISERGEFFTAKCVSAAKRIGAGLIGAGLIRTPDLFWAAKYLKEHSDDQDYARKCRESIFAAEGAIVIFPEPPVETTSLAQEMQTDALPMPEVEVKAE
ncbi:MAG TPA: hypothetical protein VFN27_05765 [Xanthobacteraceae bacterium]|nr:hypothetical protein [Xanthobacteraceae bacterium]